MKTTVIYHKADYDGIFCREIARKFLPDAEFIGWDFGDPSPLIPFQPDSPPTIYVLDLPCDRIFGFDFSRSPADKDGFKNVVWIDHHKSSIESHPKEIPGYRIDGVGACRLAWQWFTTLNGGLNDTVPFLPKKEHFLDRKVSEPLAVRMAGEYDIWDCRPCNLEFQFGLDSQHALDWERMFAVDSYADSIAQQGAVTMRCYAKRDADIMRERSFTVEFEALKFLCLNTARCNSNSFAARDVPETGHDALLGFYYNGSVWTISLYHAAHRKDLDLSTIAVKYKGGGHRGACGFRLVKLPF